MTKRNEQLLKISGSSKLHKKPESTSKTKNLLTSQNSTEKWPNTKLSIFFFIASQCLLKHVCQLHQSVPQYRIRIQELWWCQLNYRCIYFLLPNNQCTFQTQPTQSHSKLRTFLLDQFYALKLIIFHLQYAGKPEPCLWKKENPFFQLSKKLKQTDFALKKRTGRWRNRQNLKVWQDWYEL